MFQIRDIGKQDHPAHVPYPGRHIRTGSGVSATFVIVFIIFGAFLSQSGGARFFNELALAIAGGKPGGPAKVAVVASGLLERSTALPLPTLQQQAPSRSLS
jgi:hypothetical protein